MDIRTIKSLFKLLPLAGLFLANIGCQDGYQAGAQNSGYSNYPTQSQVYRPTTNRNPVAPTTFPSRQVPLANTPVAPRTAAPRIPLTNNPVVPQAPSPTTRNLPQLRPALSAPQPRRVPLPTPRPLDSRTSADLQRPAPTAPPAPPSGNDVYGTGPASGGLPAAPPVVTAPLPTREELQEPEDIYHFYQEFIQHAHTGLLQAQQSSPTGARATAEKKRLIENLRSVSHHPNESYEAKGKLFRAAVDEHHRTKRGGVGSAIEKAIAGYPDEFVLVLNDLFPNEYTVPVKQQEPERLIAQDFFNQYLRAAFRAFKEDPDMAKINDFAEALATGARKDPVGYKALDRALMRRRRSSDLGLFRLAWSNYLKLFHAKHNDGSLADITVRERTLWWDAHEIEGDDLGDWKDRAGRAMSGIYEALLLWQRAG